MVHHVVEIHIIKYPTTEILFNIGMDFLNNDYFCRALTETLLGNI